MIADAQRIRDGGQRRIHRADAGEKACIHDVKIVEFVCLAIHIEHRIFRIGAKATRARLVADARDGNVLAEIKIVRNQVRVHVEMLQQSLQFSPQPINRLLIGELVMKLDFVFGIQCDAILR